jgi:hypothetical protein
MDGSVLQEFSVLQHQSFLAVSQYVYLVRWTITGGSHDYIYLYLNVEIKFCLDFDCSQWGDY